MLVWLAGRRSGQRRERPIGSVRKRVLKAVNNFPTSRPKFVDTLWVEVDKNGALWGNWLFATHL